MAPSNHQRRAIKKGSFPVVAGTNSNSDTFGGGGATYTCNLPAGLLAGELMVVGAICFHNADPGQLLTPSGWTKLAEGSRSSIRALQVFAKSAAGGETTQNFIGSTSTLAVGFISYRIQNWLSADAATPVDDFSSNPNPPSLTPSWGAKKTLWLPFMGSTGDPSAAPTNYTDFIERSTVAGPTFIASAIRNLEAASENPGAFTAVAGSWVATTVAIRGLG